ncbi:hypothetical protein PAMP_001867 [Pampus punctatissimus]
MSTVQSPDFRGGRHHVTALLTTVGAANEGSPPPTPTAHNARTPSPSEGTHHPAAEPGPSPAERKERVLGAGAWPGLIQNAETT